MFAGRSHGSEQFGHLSPTSTSIGGNIEAVGAVAMRQGAANVARDGLLLGRRERARQRPSAAGELERGRGIVVAGAGAAGAGASG